MRYIISFLSYAPAESEFKRVLNELQAISPPAFQDFIAIGVQNFCEAFISPQCKCEVVTSNICKTFNGCILRARSKLLIDMLEDIRHMLMERMQSKKEMMLKSNDDICPSIRKKLEKNKTETRFCHVTPAANMKFEVQELDRSYVVNLLNHACSCRYWDICGIPCKHAISCIIWLKEDPDQYVDNYYKREAYMKTYEFLLEPLTGKDTWPEVEGPPVLPPHVKKMSSRPKKKRRREMNEEQSSTSRLSRRGTIITWKLCHQVGHNRRICHTKAQASSSRTDTDTQVELDLVEKEVEEVVEEQESLAIQQHFPENEQLRLKDLDFSLVKKREVPILECLDQVYRYAHLMVNGVAR
ncbi:hypothetical protein Cni_G16178 [Canna indica]|uniref:SWIM-type domain-containing protein n=1 Tax=Canna indica TaxID=4628 RepID=A0AAQ3KEY7_9LILI|nr:hypothetical protein Cni_G16178 [Canna indica]